MNVNTMEKTLKYIAIALIFVAGAAFFYILGLGTGLFIAQTPQAAAVTATPMPPATTMAAPTAAAPTLSPPPTSTPVPLTPTAPPPPTPTVVRQPSEGEKDSFDIFWEAWHILEEQFYGELPTETDLPYAAIQGVINATGDPYTAFLDPVRAEIFSTDLSGSFEGIGATVRQRPDGRFEIVEPLTGYPAIQAGVRAGDIIVEVDGTDLEGMNIYEAIALIRGPAGTVVRLLIERDGVDEPFIIEIERARIELPVVESEMREDGIAYVRLTEFGRTATDKLRQALQDLLAQNPRGLILDLRGNPGGYLTVSIEVASEFIGEGPILIERFKDGREKTYDALPNGVALDIPLVVLVNGGTASASEIVAGAIQDYERGVLIGTTTLGKGSVQLVYSLSDGSQLRVTNARWFTPNDRAIHEQGLQPDIEVELTEEDITAGADPQLDRAVEYLLEGN